MKKWERERAETAEKIGLSVEETEDLLKNLPYSVIPDWYDVVEIVAWFEAHGWVKQSSEPLDERIAARKNAKSVLTIRDYSGSHFNMCGGSNGSCFVPWCSCPCHAWLREQEANNG